MGLLLPMQEKTYRRLLMLQNALNTMLPHHAGLNPKAFRFVSTYGTCWTLVITVGGGHILYFNIWYLLYLFSRMLHSDRRSLQNAVRNILDGELLNKYLYLSTMERSELAKKIGTTQDIVSPPREERARTQWSVCLSYSNVLLILSSITRSWMIFWRSTE